MSIFNIFKEMTAWCRNKRQSDRAEPNGMSRSEMLKN